MKSLVLFTCSVLFVLKKGSEGVESCSPGWPGELDLTGIDDEEIDKVVIDTPWPILCFTPSK